MLNVFTIRDGDLVELSVGHTFAYILEGGILEETEELYGSENGGEYYHYYRCTSDGMESIEKIVRDPSTLIWGRVDQEHGGRDVSEEEAMSVVNYYREKRLNLQMKFFSDYSLQ